MTPEPAPPMAVIGNLNVDRWVQRVERLPPWDEAWLIDSARGELAGTAGYILAACQ